MVDRRIKTGYCMAPDRILVARAALHMWEETCISGKEGSGTVFFCGCNLRCVYCQNFDISRMNTGKEVSIERLGEIFLELWKKGANNINLVTPTHYVKQIIPAIEYAKSKGLNIPIIYNCGGYESVETIKLLKGYVDVFLPDFKYVDRELSSKYSGAPDYYEVASKALDKMYEIVGKPEFDERGIIKKGMIVRHLLLPGCIKDSKAVIKYIYDRFGNNVYISIMSQYTPLREIKEYPNLNRKVYPAEYKRLVDYAVEIGVTNGYVQEGDCADESFIPGFDNEGV